jgi:hypothetical protein
LCTPGSGSDLHGLLRAELLRLGRDPDLDVRYRTGDNSAGLRGLESGDCAAAVLPRRTLSALPEDTELLRSLGGVPYPVWLTGPQVPAETGEQLRMALASWSPKDTGPDALTAVYTP